MLEKLLVLSARRVGNLREYILARHRTVHYYCRYKGLRLPKINVLDRYLLSRPEHHGLTLADVLHKLQFFLDRIAYSGWKS